MFANCSSTRSRSQNWNTKSTNYSKKIIPPPLSRAKLIVKSEVHHLVIPTWFMVLNCRRFFIILMTIVIVNRVVVKEVSCIYHNHNPSSTTYSKSITTTKTQTNKLPETARIIYLVIIKIIHIRSRKSNAIMLELIKNQTSKKR